jgi:hypothetical protein
MNPKIIKLQECISFNYFIYQEVSNKAFATFIDVHFGVFAGGLSIKDCPKLTDALYRVFKS